MSEAGGERLGVFGGTFDPVHNGHLAAAVNVRSTLGLDRVLMIPAGEPWQKQHRFVAPAVDRVAMLEAAVDGIDGVEVSRLEVDRPGPTYTADTLEELRANEPAAELLLILGADAAADLDTWDRIDVLQREATIVIVSRAGTGSTPRLADPWRSIHVEIPSLEISSSDLRRRAGAGEPLDGLMPSAAIRCLRERGLYPGP